MRGKNPTTLLDRAAWQLRALARACAFEPRDEEESLGLLGVLAASWGGRLLAEEPRWSGVTDDCSPLEFSLAVGGGPPELRLLIEAQQDPANPQTYWAAGLRLADEIATRYGADLARLERVADLFRPSAQVYFSMLHGVVLRPGSRPLFKVYLNPKARGPLSAPGVVENAFARLGLRAAWPAVAATLRPDDELQFLALDLETGGRARVKLYVRHRRATVEDLERAGAPAEDVVDGDARMLCETVFAAKAPRLPRPPISMYTLFPGRARPAHWALHLPTFPFVGDDAVMRERVSELLLRCGLPVSTYARCVDALAGGPPHATHGVHNYVSFQRQGGAPRVTVYLCPRMYLERLGPIGFDPKVAWPTPVN